MKSVSTFVTSVSVSRFLYTNCCMLHGGNLGLVLVVGSNYIFGNLIESFLFLVSIIDID